MKYLILFLVLTSPLARADGSSFAEIKSVLLDEKANPQSEDELKEWELYRESRLPQYKVDSSQFIVNGVDRLLKAAVRTTTEKADFYPRLTKLLHPNGICLTGTWNIDARTPYTGYFATGRRGLFVGRASVAMSDTRAEDKRGFGFAGKIYPTLDPQEPTAATANFFTVDILLGAHTQRFADTATTNEPEVGFDFSLIGLALKIASTLSKADQNPGFRPLTQISELGLESGVVARTPHWLKIQIDPTLPKTDEADFRDELDVRKNYPQGLRLLVSVSDTTKDRKSNSGWNQIGHIDIDQSYVSYGCDRQLHFGHPKLK